MWQRQRVIDNLSGKLFFPYTFLIAHLAERGKAKIEESTKRKEKNCVCEKKARLRYMYLRIFSGSFVFSCLRTLESFIIRLRVFRIRSSRVFVSIVYARLRTKSSMWKNKWSFKCINSGEHKFLYITSWLILLPDINIACIYIHVVGTAAFPQFIVNLFDYGARRWSVLLFAVFIFNVLLALAISLD